MSERGIEVGGLPLLPPYGVESRAITMENRTGARGAGGKAMAGRKGAPAHFDFQPGETFTLAEIEEPGCIRHIWITTPPGQPLRDRNLILRIYWDGQGHPSVECPLSDFFGVAHGRRVPFSSALTVMAEGRGLSCYYAMPFARSCRITIENDTNESAGPLFFQIDYTLGDAVAPGSGYFHCQFRRQNPTTLREDYVLLDGLVGRGRFLGCVVGIRTLDAHWWGEGEMKFYLDGDRENPTICGTGAEDYVCSAWGLSRHHTPYHGCPLHLAGEQERNSLVSFYRWHVQDPIWFHRTLKATLQQLGGAPTAALRERLEGDSSLAVGPTGAEGDFTVYERQDDVSSAAFWYQTLPTVPFPTLPGRALRSIGLEKRAGE